MRTYSITAFCRTNGAIGAPQHEVFAVEADSLYAATLKAYDTHEAFEPGASIFDHHTARSYNFFSLDPHEA